MFLRRHPWFREPPCMDIDVWAEYTNWLVQFFSDFSRLRQVLWTSTIVSWLSRCTRYVFVLLLPKPVDCLRLRHFFVVSLSFDVSCTIRIGTIYELYGTVFLSVVKIHFTNLTLKNIPSRKGTAKLFVFRNKTYSGFLQRVREALSCRWLLFLVCHISQSQFSVDADLAHLVRIDSVLTQ